MLIRRFTNASYIGDLQVSINFALETKKHKYEIDMLIGAYFTYRWQ